MLNLLTGIKRNNKLDIIFSEISALIDEGKKVYLIVPEQSSFERDREFLFRYGEKKSNKLTVTGISRLVADMLDEKGLKIKPDADDAARNVLMSLAAEDVSDSLEIYSRHMGRVGLVRELLTEYSEIKQAGFPVSELGRVSAFLPDGRLKTKTDELSRIFAAYEALVGERFSEVTDNINVAAEYLKDHDVYSGCVFYFFDYRGFTGSQLGFIRQIIRQAEKLNVAVTCPSAVSSNQSEAFEHAVRTVRALKKAAALENVPVTERNTDLPSSENEFDVLSSSLYSFERESFRYPTDRINVISADNRYEECDYIACEIKRLLREEGLRCREIAVADRTGEYASCLTASLKKYDVPVFNDCSSALTDYPLIKAVLCAVKCAVYGFGSDELISLIKTSMTGITSEECALIESYVYLWQIDGRAWERDFRDNPSGFGVLFEDEDRATLAKLNEIRNRLISPVAALRKALNQKNGDSSCRAVYDYLIAIKAGKNFCEYAKALNENGDADEAKQCASVWDSLMTSLDALHAAIKDRSVSPERFLQLLTVMLSSGEIGKIPAGIDEIVIGRADRSRFSGIKVLFVAGLNEGVFPLSTQPGGLFTLRERKALSECDFTLENIPENMYAEERYISYLTLNVPTEKLYVSFPRATVSGEQLRPSELISEIMSVFPECRKVNTSSIKPEDRIGSPETAFEQYSCQRGKKNESAVSLLSFLSSDEKNTGRLSALERSADKLPSGFRDKALANRLFGHDMYVSPSKAEIYSKCPFMYFCRYGMRVDKQMTAGLDPRINGLLIHHVLEVILGDKTGSRINEKTDAELKADIDRITEEYINDYIGGREDKTKSFNKSLDRIKAEIFEILKRLVAEFGTSLFEIKDVELVIGPDGDIAPYRIELPDGGSVTIGGTVDRIDVMDDDGRAYLRVIDYKTGGKEFDLCDVFSGLNMQMLIYLMCLWDNGKERYGNVIPAGVLYVPAKSGGEHLGRRANDEEVEKQKLRNGRMNGMILANERVLKGMDISANGRFINAVIDKNGEMKGNLISLSDFTLLHKKIDSVLTDTAMRLHNGEIPVLPVITADYPHTCEYCDYQNVCLREPGDPSRQTLSMSHKDSIEYLEKEAAENGKTVE